MDDRETALVVALQHLDPDDITCIADSLLQRRLMTRERLVAVAKSIGGSAFSAVVRADGLAESGIETRVRLWLESRGIAFRAQAVIVGVGRVDFLIGKRLVIEVDGKAHHTGVERFHRDRDRDLELKARGYEVIRLTYAHVVHDWERASARIAAIIQRRQHLHPPKDAFGLRFS